MQASAPETKPRRKVGGTEILASDSPQQYREKLARIAMDEMYQFVAVLDAKGTLLEVNRAALVGGGLKLSDVEGKPFWECFWWGLSKEIQETLKQAIQRASRGEFIRYDVEIYGRASGKETIIIDFSMIPVTDEKGKVVYIVPEGREIIEKKAQERESKVLVVDDNVDAAEVLAEALSFMGHEVRVAHGGPDALTAAQSFPATTVLLDIGLPVMDGYELARLLRQVWADRPVRFVAITGYGQEADKEKAKASGFDVHLVKPVDLDVLTALFEHPSIGAS